MEFLKTRIQYNIDGKDFILPKINSAVDAMVDHMFKHKSLNKENIKAQFSQRVFYNKNGKKLSIFEIIEDETVYSSSTVEKSSQVNWMSLWSCAGSSISKLHLAEQITIKEVNEFITILKNQKLIPHKNQTYQRSLKIKLNPSLEKASQKAQFLKWYINFLNKHVKTPEHISFKASNSPKHLAEAHDEKYKKNPLRKIIPNCSIYEDHENLGFYNVNIPEGTTKKQLIQAVLFLNDMKEDK